MSRYIGKIVGGDIYVHQDAISHASPEVQNAMALALKSTDKEQDRDYNVVRFSKRRNTVSLLLYDAFFEEPFPVLQHSIVVNLSTKTTTHRDYLSSKNPPVLHRKELLLAPDHPSAANAYAVTELLEEAGLFSDAHLIGTWQAWRRRLEESGFGWLLSNSNERDQKITGVTNRPKNVARHRTAISRYVLSRPMQFLEKHGYLDSQHTIFDYGCGKGDDLRGLKDMGVNAAGWDPHFRPAAEQIPSDIVNLGYVINVIEEKPERLETVQNAYQLCERLLVVSAQLLSANPGEHKIYKDGLLTSRGTFQKYFSHQELKDFILEALQVTPIAVAPGIYFVFKNEIAEQDFLEARQRARAFSRPRIYIPRLSASEKRQEIYDRHKESLEAFWGAWLELARPPTADELNFDLKDLLVEFGSIRRISSFLITFNGDETIRESAQERVNDLLVYFALNLFSGRPRYKEQSPRMQRDIKAFFRNLSTAIDEARALLFSIREVDLISAECQAAADVGIGFLDQNHSLTLHSSQVNLLSPLLRVYIGCASTLYGDVENSDLVKIHINSGKLSVMSYEAFNDSPLPLLRERVKIKMREQDIDFFDYGDDFPSPYLFEKSKYLPETFPSYPEQIEFDTKLTQLKFLEDPARRLTAAEFDYALDAQNLQIEGFELTLKGIPADLDQACGKYLTYRGLIECGETQAATKIENRPLELDTYCALYDLATRVLDPVIDYFGMVKVTYGFCSRALSKKITGRIAPDLDQHASCELKKNRTPICPRLGAAVDFLVEDEDMHEVASWVIENTPFDRLYFYGSDRPIHVSFGPEFNRQIVVLLPTRTGAKRPAVVSESKFREKLWNKKDE